MLIVLTKLTAPARRQSWSRFSLGRSQRSFVRRDHRNKLALNNLL
jgi:hypothetical protein